MWVEKIIIEKMDVSMDGNLEMRSLIITDKEGEPILISERTRWLEYPFGEVPFKIIINNDDLEILEYYSKSKEWYKRKDDTIEARITWKYIPLRDAASGVYYWLRLPTNSVITNLKKISPDKNYRYSIVKDNKTRTLWIRSMFSNYDTNGKGLDFIVRFKIDPIDFDRYEVNDHMPNSWMHDILNILDHRNIATSLVLEIIKKFLGI